MRKALLLFFILSLLTACSDENGAAQSQQDFQKALSLFNEAQQGYILRGDRTGAIDGQMSKDIAYYRQQKLDQAATQFRSLLNKGSDSQRLAASLLLADAQASAADYTARQAMANWADLARRSSALMDQLLVIDQALNPCRIAPISTSPHSCKNSTMTSRPRRGEIGGLEKGSPEPPRYGPRGINR